MTTGSVIGIIGIALCVLLCGVGSALGLYKTGSAAAGVLGENPATTKGTTIIEMISPKIA
mgnify:CR=1 FL=1